jgi:hypothetical protein
MNRHVMVFLAAAAFALLLSATPATAQNQGNGIGQGPAGVAFCAPAKTPGFCPSGANVYGPCVSTFNVCTNVVKTGNPNLVSNCCEKCFAATDLCGIPHFPTCPAFCM